MARMGVAARTANDPPMAMREGPTAAALTQLTPTPIASDEQGIGKSPGFQWPWMRSFQALVPKILKQGAVGATAAGLELPTRPETRSWADRYLLYYEQTSRHVWPLSPHVIEHDESVPLVTLAPHLGE
jgi:hypothetical protein